MQQVNTAPKKENSRTFAGKAFVVFLALMVLLTLTSRALEEMTIATVQAIRPQRGSLEKQVTAEGTLRASSLTPIVIADEVRVKEVTAPEGSMVQTGDALFVLDYQTEAKRLYEAYLAASDSQVKAQQAFTWASADLGEDGIKRMESRVKSLASAAKQLDEDLSELAQAQQGDDSYTIRIAKRNAEDAQDVYDAAKQRIDGATITRDYTEKQLALQEANEKLEQSAADYLALLTASDGAATNNMIPAFAENQPYLRTILAPHAGTVQKVNVTAGATHSASQPAMQISDSSNGLLLDITVSNDDAKDMAVGESASLVVNGQMTDSVITSIVPSEESPGSYIVKFQLPASIGDAGMRGTMYYTKRSQTYQTLIPLSALRSDEIGDFVYIISQGDTALGMHQTLVRADVIILKKDSTRAAVQGGITQQDQLAARSDRSVEAGDRVKLSEE
ncbi:MAG: HlyD family efflux transporter periplasmic adaptor subunit [Clostridiales bacterium]|nr:HlyD family efflux transporter periplasmic adaptor subunit [Clostridiales bacterium]